MLAMSYDIICDVVFEFEIIFVVGGMVSLTMKRSSR